MDDRQWEVRSLQDDIREERSVQQEIYRRAEAMVRPILRSNAKRFARQLDLSFDDAMQEAQIALIRALRRYDYNKCRGGMFLFMKKAVGRHFLKLLAHHRAQLRQPHLKTRNAEGKRVTMRLAFLRPVSSERARYAHNARSEDEFDGDFMDLIESPAAAPDSALAAAENEWRLQAFCVALDAALKGRDREVLRCKLDPPRGLRALMVEDCSKEPTNKLIGKYLGLSKNEIDWAFRHIRAAAEKLIATEFSDMTDLALHRSHVERRL